MDDLIEPVAVAGGRTAPRKAAVGHDSAEPGLGELRPKRARITPP
jgi:hypothetical protein